MGVVNLCPTIDSVNCFDSPGKFERPIALLVKMYDPFAFFQSFSISKKYPFNLIEIERISRFLYFRPQIKFCGWAYKLAHNM